MNKNFLIIIFSLFIISIIMIIITNKERFTNVKQFTNVKKNTNQCNTCSQKRVSPPEQFTNFLKDVKEYNTKPDDNSMLVDVPADFFSHAREEIIIPEPNKDNNFPLSKELDVVDPVVTHPAVLPNQAFKDNLFVRDAGVNRAMERLNKNTTENYKDAANSHSTFMVPKDSKDLISYKNYDEIPKEERDKMYLADIHDMMTGKVNENINKDELGRIMGKPIVYEDVKDMYKPVFVSIDPDQTGEMFKNIEYKFSGYTDLPFGSMI